MSLVLFPVFPEKMSAMEFQGKLIDLTHVFENHMPSWPTGEVFKLFKSQDWERIHDGFLSQHYASPEHIGTHIDAPVHFIANGTTVDDIPLKQLIGRGVVVNISAQCRENADYQLRIEDIVGHEKRFGRIPDGSIVLVRTGFSEYWPDKKRYIGTEEQGEKGLNEMHFPGLKADAAEWLIRERSVKAVGIDTLGTDYGQSLSFATHRILAARNIPAFENVTNLAQLPEMGFTVIALPMKIAYGTGAPLRIIAILDKE